MKPIASPVVGERRRAGKLKVVIAYLLGIATLPVLAYLVAYSGHFPVATNSHPLPLEVSLADRALHYASVDGAPAVVPVKVSDAGLTSSAQLYATECAFCHGLPGQAVPHAATGMFPPPPQFFTKVDDDPTGVIYWRIKNGIRLTGMPAFRPTLSDDQIWSLALLLQRAKRLPAPAQAELHPNH
ncbi:MAG: cytochrome c [Acidobacteria bacterium]|nr:MAG: cytochrome c [Acidobacteriota bacterium]